MYSGASGRAPIPFMFLMRLTLYRYPVIREHVCSDQFSKYLFIFGDSYTATSFNANGYRAKPRPPTRSATPTCPQHARLVHSLPGHLAFARLLAIISATTSSSSF